MHAATVSFCLVFSAAAGALLAQDSRYIVISTGVDRSCTPETSQSEAQVFSFHHSELAPAFVAGLLFCSFVPVFSVLFLAAEIYGVPLVAGETVHVVPLLWWCLSCTSLTDPTYSNNRKEIRSPAVELYTVKQL